MGMEWLNRIGTAVKEIGGIAWDDVVWVGDTLYDGGKAVVDATGRAYNNNIDTEKVCHAYKEIYNLQLGEENFGQMFFSPFQGDDLQALDGKVVFSASQAATYYDHVQQKGEENVKAAKDGNPPKLTNEQWGILIKKLEEFYQSDDKEKWFVADQILYYMISMRPNDAELCVGKGPYVFTPPERPSYPSKVGRWIFGIDKQGEKYLQYLRQEYDAGRIQPDAKTTTTDTNTDSNTDTNTNTNTNTDTDTNTTNVSRTTQQTQNLNQNLQNQNANNQQNGVQSYQDIRNEVERATGLNGSGIGVGTGLTGAMPAAAQKTAQEESVWSKYGSMILLSLAGLGIYLYSFIKKKNKDTKAANAETKAAQEQTEALTTQVSALTNQVAELQKQNAYLASLANSQNNAAAGNANNNSSNNASGNTNGSQNNAATSNTNNGSLANNAVAVNEEWNAQIDSLLNTSCRV